MNIYSPQRIFIQSRRIKPRKPCDIRHLRGFSYFRENSLSRVFSYVLRVLFPLIKMGISLTTATVLRVFWTKGKIAFCASRYIFGSFFFQEKGTKAAGG